jgi:hypothetical protein
MGSRAGRRRRDDRCDHRHAGVGQAGAPIAPRRSITAHPVRLIPPCADRQDDTQDAERHQNHTRQDWCCICVGVGHFDHAAYDEQRAYDSRYRRDCPSGCRSNPTQPQPPPVVLRSAVSRNDNGDHRESDNARNEYPDRQ